MTAVATPELDQEREAWIDAVRALTRDITRWSEEQGWEVSRESKHLKERGLNEYRLPKLSVRAGDRELWVEPIAREIGGGSKGRVDLSAYPTLYRVMLLRSASTGDWRIRTDSGIFLDKPWNKETFAKLFQDLTDA
jgi:hypothetical protein